MDRCILDTDILSEYLKGHNAGSISAIAKSVAVAPAER